MTVPSWVKDSIFYQIFPDRFCNGSQENDPVNVLPWGATPTSSGFHGGDLRGIIDRMYYLIELGVNALYLNPIFLSPSNHRYNTVDYYRVDPKLGSQAELLTLLDVAHRNDVHVILDGVFNHCGRGFFAFSDILENQAASPYVNWFHVYKFPLDAYSPGDATNFAGWWKHKSLPKFNTNEPAVRKYILGVARYWMEQGFDGWRLDVPNEIDDDAFWDEFRSTVRTVNPDAYLLGEIWDGNPRWVGEHHFDGLMNYPIRTLLIDLLLQKQSSVEFSRAVEDWLHKFPLENVFAQYNLLGSHDTERILTVLGQNVDKLKLALLFQFTYPGAPAIYYGDEVGLTGGADPDCRKAFPWDETDWNAPLRQWMQKLSRLRGERTALRQGTMAFVDCANPAGLAYTRTSQEDFALVMLNPTDEAQRLQVKLSEVNLRNVMASEELAIENGILSATLPPWEGQIYCRND